MTRTYATPLVGRELEKTLLIGTFERSAQQRSCQLVTIVGEPGVGKSRLVRRALRDTSRIAPGSSAGGRVAACRTATGSPSGRSGRSSRRSAASSSRTRRTRRRRSSSGRCPPDDPDRAWLRVAAGAARRALPASPPRRRSRSRPGGASSSRWPRGAADGARLRGPALGRRRAALLPRAPRRLVRRACRCSFSAQRARSCTSGIRPGRRGCATRTTINLAPLTDEETAPPRLVAARARRCCRRRPSARCSSGRAATRSTRRSSCACSPTGSR